MNRKLLSMLLAVSMIAASVPVYAQNDAAAVEQSSVVADVSESVHQFKSGRQRNAEAAEEVVEEEISVELFAADATVGDFTVQYDTVAGTAVFTAYSGKATEVEIPATVEIDGVVYNVISLKCFKDNETITSVKLPDGLTSIGEYAFSNCTSLKSVNIPDTVTSIAKYAFRGCTSLERAVIPAGVTSVATYAFSGCTGLKYMYFKGAVPTTIGNKAFGSFSKETVIYCNSVYESEYLASDDFAAQKLEIVDDYFVVEDGVLVGLNPEVDGDTPRDIVAIPGYIIDSYIPVNEVAENIFDSVSGIKTVVIPQGTKMKFTAFPESVTTVYFRGEAPDAEIALSSDATIYMTPENEKSFTESPYWSQFTRKTYEDVFEFNTKTHAITSYLKESTKDNRSVEIPSDIYGEPVEIIAGSVFEGYQYIESVKIPDSVKLIDGEAFSGCINLYAINADENDENVLRVPFIGEGAFYGCESLSQIRLDNVCIVGEGSFFNCRNLSKLEINGDADFEFGKTLKEPYIIYLALYLLYDVENYADYYNSKGAIIGSDAFCGNLETGSNATAEDGVAPSLKDKVTLTNVGFIDEFAFNGTGIKEVVVPEGVKKIGRAAFGFCKSLESVTLPSTLEILESGSNYKPGDTDREKAGDGVFAYCESLVDIVIPDSVTDIGTLTFAGSGIADIKLSENITTVPAGLFKDCKAMETIVIPEKVISIDDASIAGSSANVKYGAFAGCTSLKDVKTSSALENIGSFAFSGCTALKTIACESGRVSDSLKTIGKQAFDGCTVLASEDSATEALWLPDSVESIGEKAFQSCKALRLKDGMLPTSLAALGQSAFINCAALTSVKIPASLTVIDVSVFKATGLVNLEIPSTVKTVGKTAFEGCKSLEEVTFADGTEALTVSESAFRDCAALKNVTFGRDDVTVGKTAFKACKALESINTEKVDKISVGDQAFNECAALTNSGLRSDINVVFGVKVYQDSGLTEFVVPDSVVVIPVGMFADCKALSNVTLHDKVTTISGDKTNRGAFAGCTALKTIELPESVVDIQSYAFNASGLESITLPDSVTVVNPAVFLDCTSLAEVNLGNATEIIGGLHTYTEKEFSTATKLTDSKFSGAFEDCTALESIKLPETVKEIQSFAFAGSGIKSFEYPEGFEKVADGVFYNCQNLEMITLNEELTTIGRFSFANCPKLTEVEVPGAVTQVSTRAFMNDTALETVRIGDVEGKKIVTLESAAFNNCTALEYIVFSGILPAYSESLFGSTEIRPTILYFTRFFDEAREDDISWQENYTMVAIDKQFDYSETADGECSIEFYKGDLPMAIIPGVVLDENGSSMLVKSISEGAFDGSDVTAISLPRGVEGLSNRVFFGAEKLEKIKVSALNENYRTTDGVLYNKNGNTLIYCPSGKYGVFDIGDGVTTVETGAFYGNSLSAITVSDTNKYYSSADGVLMSKSGDVIVAYPNSKGAAYTVAETVTAIEDYAFTNAAMTITFAGLTAPAATANAIAEGATIKVYPDATGFDGDAFADLKILFVGKAIIDKVEKLDDGTFNVTYHNYNEESVSAKTFAALYAGGVLMQVTSEEDVALASGEETVKNFSFDKTGDTVKVFIWDSWEGMVPVEEAAVQNY